MSALGRHFAHHRIAWSRAAVAVLLAVVLLARPGALHGLPAWLNQTSEMIGYFLLVSACLWRIWCSLFIGGSKNGELACEGPYSIVRNPLYIGNFIGIVGIGFAVMQPVLGILLGAMFAISYPYVIAQEEADLTRIFGEPYREYCARVPRWLPKLSLYREPVQLTVTPRFVRKAIFDAMWFLWAFGLWEMIEELHELNLLPNLF